MRKTVLFTGGSGLLALNWANLIKHKYRVILAMHHRKVELDGVFSANLDFSSVESILESLTQLGVDLVVNCVGFTSVELCEKDSSQAEYVNGVLARDVAIACSRAEIGLIHISTDHLFNGQIAFSTEEQVTSPINVYGETKLQGEEFVKQIHESALIIRTNFFGWGTTYRRSFSDFIIDNLQNNKPIYLFRDVFYTPILIDELVRAVESLLEEGASGIFNVTGPDRISKFEFGLKLAGIFNLDKSLIEISSFSDRQDLVKRPLDLSLNNEKVNGYLLSPIKSIDEQIQALYNAEQTGANKSIVKL